MQLIYPATANAAAAKFTLPFAPIAGVHAGLYQGYGAPQMRAWIIAGNAFAEFLDAVTSAAKTNAQLSGTNTIWHGTFIAAI